MHIVWGLCILAAMALLNGCGTPSRRSVSSPESLPSRLNAEAAKSVTVYAIGLVGTPYRWGGNTPESGFDCSGLIAHVYQKSAQLQSPRTVAELQSWGSPLISKDPRTGDLVVFSKGGEATHAGIYVGEGRFVHAPSTGGRVRLDRINTPYWASYQVAFSRP
jgi:cell wall-associated NlpC family hydrolase